MARPSTRLARFAPRMDRLESRELLSTLTVTTTADDGPGSLRAQVAAAASGDLINFSPTLTDRTITLTSGPIFSTGKSLTIDGLGADHLTISGGGKSTILVLQQDSSPGAPTIDVAISDLTLADGNSPYSGGALYTYGANLTLSRDVVRDSTAQSFGGGVDAETPYNPSGPVNTVTIVNTNFLNDSASGGGAFQSYGLNVSITGGTISGNTAQGGGGILLGNGSLTVSGALVTNNVGGGLEYYGGYTPDTANLAISGSRFEGNSLSSGFGGAVQANQGAVTISSSTFRGNTDTDPNFAQGGAVAILSGTASVDRSTFLGNSAANPTAQLARGGGLFIEDASAATVTNSTFRDNSVVGQQVAGAGMSRSFVYGFFPQPPTTTVSGDSFVNNTATGSYSATGAGLNVQGDLGSTTVSNSSFSGNQAVGQATSSAFGQGGYAQGGALSASAGFSYGPPATLTVSGTSFTGNSAAGGSARSAGWARAGRSSSAAMAPRRSRMIRSWPMPRRPGPRPRPGATATWPRAGRSSSSMAARWRSRDRRSRAIRPTEATPAPAAPEGRPREGRSPGRSAR